MATLTIHAYGNVDALHGIFNAVAMIMNSSSFEHIIRMAVVIGFAVVLTLVAFPENLRKGWTWFVAVMVISTVMLGPKTDVSIEDRTGQQATVVVSNVPWTLALMASVKTVIGWSLTELFETAFQTIPSSSRQLPSELLYQNTGMMLGSRLVRASLEARPTSGYDQADLVQYIRSCVMPEIGRAIPSDGAARSNDLASLYGNTNPALSAAYHDPAAGWVLKVEPCPTVWTALQSRLSAAGVAEISKVAAKELAGAFQVSNSAATGQATSGLLAMYGKAALANSSANASSIMVQNILINATADAAAQGVSADDPGVLMLASMRTQAMAQMNAGNITQGRIAEESLPMIRNLTEGILYAAFPLLCILLVASEGRSMGSLFKSYAYALIWVEMWAPMFAIVNYLQTLSFGKSAAGAGFLPGSGDTGLSVLTASAIYTESVSSLATTAWMVTFVPVLAAAVVFGFDRIMSITGAMGGGTKATQGEAANSTKGNTSMGQVNFDKQDLASYRSSPSMHRQESTGGVQFSDGATGEVLNQFRKPTLPVSAKLSTQAGEALAQGAAAEARAGEGARKSSDRSYDAAFSTALRATQQSDAGKRLSSGWGTDLSTATGLTRTEEDSVVKKVMEKTGLADESAVRKALEVGTPGLLPIPVKAGASSAEQESLKSEVTADIDAARRLGAQRKRDFVEQFRHGENFERVRSGSRSASEAVDSSVREAEGYRTSAESHFARAQSLTQKWEGFQRYVRDFGAEADVVVDRFFQRKGYSPQNGVFDGMQATRYLAELASQGTIRFDTPDGRPMWIPPDPSAAYAAPDEVGLRVLREAGPGGLLTRHQQAEPGGGRAAIDSAAAEGASRTVARQRKLGVTPTGEPDGSTVVRKVQGDRGAAAVEVADAKAETHAAQGRLAKDYSDRTKSVSDNHRVGKHLGLNKGENPAADAVSRSPQTVFPEEAEVDQKRREREAISEAQRQAELRAQLKQLPPDALPVRPK